MVYNTATNELLINVLDVPQPTKRLFKQRETNHLSFKVPNPRDHEVFQDYWTTVHGNSAYSANIVFEGVDVYIDTRVDHTTLYTYKESPWDIDKWDFTVYAMK